MNHQLLTFHALMSRCAVPRPAAIAAAATWADEDFDAVLAIYVSVAQISVAQVSVAQVSWHWHASVPVCFCRRVHT